MPRMRVQVTRCGASGPRWLPAHGPRLPQPEPRPPRPRSESACALRGLVRGARGKAEAQEAKLKSRASSTPLIKFQDCV
eukprot:3578056-Rhodomonas_salina.5